MNIDHLAARYEAAKAAHDASAAALAEAHDALVEACTVRNEGAAQTLGGTYKVTVTAKVNRTIDVAALNALWPEIPEGARRVFPAKPSLDLKELRYWAANEPETYARFIAPAITAKPGKPAVKVELIEQAAKAA